MTTDTSIDVGWTLFAGCLVFFMQAGFSLLEVGFVKQKNAQSILMKNIMDVCVGAIGWFCLGYGLAFGKDSWSETEGGGVMGTSLFFVTEGKLLPKESRAPLWEPPCSSSRKGNCCRRRVGRYGNLLVLRHGRETVAERE